MRFKAVISMNISQKLSVHNVYFESWRVDKTWLSLHDADKQFWNALMATPIELDDDDVLAFGRRMSMELAAHKLYIENSQKFFDVEFEATFDAASNKVLFEQDKVPVALKCEGPPGSVGLYGYFESKPSTCQLESIFIATNRRSFGFHNSQFRPVEVPDALSARLGLKRWFICAQMP